MGLRGDERGQSVQIGAVLLFAILIISFSSYQAFVVSEQNREIEFSHNERVHQQVQDLRNALVSMAGGGSTAATSIELGTRYPSRAVALNPAPPSGTLRTVGTTDPRANVSIGNAVAEGETGDVWNGTPRNYTSGAIVYDPSYNVYQNAPTTVYENTVLYNEFRSGRVTLANQTFVDGDRISVVVVNGSFSRTQSGTTTVDATPISTSERTVRVSGTASDPVTLNFTSRLPPAEWRRILGDQSNVSSVNGYPSAVDGPFTAIEVIFVPGNYTLQLTKVGVGTGATDEPATYLADRTDGATVRQGETVTVTVEARDDYNNPVPNRQLTASVDEGSLADGTETTDQDGQATFEYDTTGATPGTQEVNVSLGAIDGTFDNETGENVTVPVTVQASGTGGGGGGVYDTSWTTPPYSGRITNGSIDAAHLRGLPATMRATDGGVAVSDAEVDYAVNDTSVAVPDGTTGRTNETGYDETALVARNEGYLRAYATTDATGDRVNLTVDRLLNESFEDPEEALVANGWYYNSTAGGGAGVKSDADLNGDGAHDGSRIAYINGSGASAGDRAIELNYSLDTSDYDAVSVTYVAREPSSVDNPDTPDSGSTWEPSENLYVQYRAGDGTWVTVDNLSSRTDTSEPVLYFRRATISVANASHDDFAVRFRQGETTAADEWQIDSVNVTGAAVESRIAGLNDDPQAHFRYDPASPDTTDTITFDANRSDDPDGYVVSYEWAFGDGTTDTGREVTTSYSSSGTYDATLTVTDEDGTANTSTQSISVGASGGFQNAGAADVLPATTGQNQSVTFTPDAEIPANTQVTITLDDPQQVSPRQVDYQGSAGTNVGSIDDKNAAGDTASVTWTSGGSPVPAGTTVRVWIDEIKTGPESQQTDPYDVTITRQDSGASTTATFEVGTNTGGAELTTLRADDLASDTVTQEQTLLFEPTTDVPAGEYVTVSLRDPESSGEVDYRNSSLSTNATVDGLDFVDQNADNASIRVQAPAGGFTAGDVIAVNVSDVYTEAMPSAPYEVAFSRGDAGTASTTFGEASGQVPTIDARVDDLTYRDSDQPRFIGSYALSNTNSSFERVEVTFSNRNDGSADQSFQPSTERGGVLYDNTYGADDTYDVTFEVVYTVGGSERVVASETITDVADAQNPGGNADLSTGSSASLTNYEIEDRTQTNQDRPRYRFTFDVSTSGSFSEARIHALNLPSSGGSGDRSITSRQNNNNEDLEFSYGSGDEYRVGILVRDADGAVVDVVSIDDVADDSGVFTGP